MGLCPVACEQPATVDQSLFDAILKGGDIQCNRCRASLRQASSYVQSTLHPSLSREESPPRPTKGVLAENTGRPAARSWKHSKTHTAYTPAQGSPTYSSSNHAVSSTSPSHSPSSSSLSLRKLGSPPALITSASSGSLSSFLESAAFFFSKLSRAPLSRKLPSSAAAAAAAAASRATAGGRPPSSPPAAAGALPPSASALAADTRAMRPSHSPSSQLARKAAREDAVGEGRPDHAGRLRPESRPRPLGSAPLPPGRSQADPGSADWSSAAARPRPSNRREQGLTVTAGRRTG
mmetsp:Transcript_88431/g.228028  ORF Transcript_88431/g.228028 Transcript_88431/m.228028 type:complete len:292 (-) Transcript_88431:87-962(-)